MEIRYGKDDKLPMTFGQLEVGDVFRAKDYTVSLFMKISVDIVKRSTGDSEEELVALDLVDGVAIELPDLEPVELLKAHVVVEE